MSEKDGAHDDDAATAQDDPAKGDVGDVEAAGETTAAEMMGGAPDTRPVGLDTLANVKVSDTADDTDEDNA